VTWLIHMCDVTHSYVWRDSFICVTWLIHRCDMTHSCVWHDSFIGVTWLIHMCDVTHSYVWRDSFICVTWLCIAQVYYWWGWEAVRDSFLHVTWLVYGDLTHLYMWHGSRMYVTQFIMVEHKFIIDKGRATVRERWHVHTRDIAHSPFWCDLIWWNMSQYDGAHVYHR